MEGSYRNSSSRKIGAVALAIGLGIITGGAAACRAQDALSDKGVNPEVSISIQDADLRSALNMLRNQTGIDVILEPGETPYGLVNVTLTNKRLDTVLRLMAQSAGASVRLENGVYVVGPKGAAPKPKVEEEPKREPIAPPVRQRGHWERIRLMNTRPSETLQYLGIEQGKVNPFERWLMQQNYDDIRNVRGGYSNFPSGAKLPTMLSFPSNNSQPSVPPVVPTGFTPPSGDNRNEEGQRGGGFGGQAGGGIGGGQFGGGGGQFGGGQGLGGGQGQGQGNASAQSLLPEGIDSILSYDVDNTIIVRGTDEAIRELKEIIRLLDIAPKQLMIRAEFVEVRQDDLRSFGIDWQVSRGALSASTFEGAYAQGDIVLNFATGNLISQLRTSLVEGKGRLVNSPMATTTNNVPVSITIGTTVPVITTSIAFGQGGQGVTVPSITPVPVFSGLFVVPRINGDNSITMLVAPFIQDIVSEVANPSGGTIPIISNQSVSVLRRIGNNETMVIGGLIKKNDRSSVKKVPLFADLPLIGNLFRSTSTTVADSELLIFVTPTILPDPISTNVPGVGSSQPVRP